jgi:predicted TPR repeat methyltransferase
MIDRARARAEEQAALHVADMRALPRFGKFDLIWAVNDAMNYLMDGAELQATLAGMKRNLAPGGVILFDVNTLAAYRTSSARRWWWSGTANGSSGRARRAPGTRPGRPSRRGSMVTGRT